MTGDVDENKYGRLQEQPVVAVGISRARQRLGTHRWGVAHDERSQRACRPANKETAQVRHRLVEATAWLVGLLSTALRRVCASPVWRVCRTLVAGRWRSSQWTTC